MEFETGWGPWKASAMAIAHGTSCSVLSFSHDFLFSPSPPFPGGIPVDCISHLLQARKILNWTTRGTRHKASFPSLQRKGEINRVQLLFTCWPATASRLCDVPFTILEVFALLMFGISSAMVIHVVSLSYSINMQFLCNY